MISRNFFIAVFTLAWSIGMLAQQSTTQPSTQPTTQPSYEGGKMSFEQKFIDLGQVTRGEVRNFEFPFTNIGNAPIKIDLVSSCDCTTTEYPTTEVMPGEKGSILVIFDSAEKEESETIDIDIFLTNEDPKTGAPIIEMLQYKYDLIK
jgi:peptidoglycan-associated lipoprotein